VHQLEAGDAGEDQKEAEEAGGRGGLLEEEDAGEDGADGADAGPDGVGGAHGEGAHGEAKEAEGGEHGDGRDDCGDELREAVALLEGDDPDGFEETCQKEEEPSHDFKLAEGDNGGTTMLIVHVHVHVKPESVEAFRAASIANATESVKEAGIARFDVIQNNEDPTRFVLVEVYRTVEATVAHKATAHYAVWRDTVAEMMAEPRVAVKYTNAFPGEGGW